MPSHFSGADPLHVDGPGAADRHGTANSADQLRLAKAAGNPDLGEGPSTGAVSPHPTELAQPSPGSAKHGIEVSQCLESLRCSGVEDIG